MKFFQRKRQSRRRAERASHLELSKGSQIECPELWPAPIAVSDLSELGARVTLAQGQQLELGKTFSGALILGKTLRLSLQFRVARSLPGEAGLEFILPSDSARIAIRAYYRPELIGASMQEASSFFQSLRLSDPEHNLLEIDLRGGSVEKFVLAAKTLRFRLSWSKGGAFQLQSTDGKSVGLGNELRNVLKMVRNMASLDSRHRSTIEQMIHLSGLGSLESSAENPEPSRTNAELDPKASNNQDL